MKSLFALLLTSVVTFIATADSHHWSAEQQAIIEVNRYAPLALPEQGFDAYSSLFHAEYTNRFMSGQGTITMDRDAFLNAVNGWYKSGNKATFSHVVPISIDVFGDYAYVRHLQQEHFVNNKGETSMFIGEFASIMKKKADKWTFYRTSFQQRYRGPINEQSPSLLNKQ